MLFLNLYNVSKHFETGFRSRKDEHKKRLVSQEVLFLHQMQNASWIFQRNRRTRWWGKIRRTARNHARKYFFRAFEPQNCIISQYRWIMIFVYKVYCKVCYLRFHGPGGHNKFGEKDTFPCDEESPEACIRCKGIQNLFCYFWFDFSSPYKSHITIQ